jgi:23S rRNA (cytidine1920-2'-O)/16S rRNA (cytidine1409-2'-O)-methyltransferase
MLSKRKIRIDELLVEKGLVESRAKAQSLIMMGRVLCNGKVIDKAGSKVNLDAEIEITQELPYVSRGGIKLESAIKKFLVDLDGMVAMDVGASTGGFTDCLLKHGVKKVYAIDVGYGILDAKLRNDERVINIEKTNIRYLNKDLIKDQIDIAVIDVSFISLTQVIPKVLEFLKPNGKIIALIKPQFELSPKEVGKGGIVKEKDLQMKAVTKISHFIQELGLKVIGTIPSPIAGKKGNQEYLIYCHL